MDESISEAGEEMEVGNTPEPKPAEEDFTAQELLKDLSGDDRADTATPPELVSPQELRVTTDERHFQHGNDTLECGGERKEHLRRKQDHVPGDSRREGLARTLEGI